jgi:GNAT superfamily N-acetyltransferase
LVSITNRKRKMGIQKNEFMISTDKKKLSIKTIYEMLKNESYWAPSRSYGKVEKSIENSLCFGLYHKDKQIGFARVVTDYITTFYLCDVIITEEYRGKGLGKMLMDAVFSNDEIQGLFGLLMTKSAHDLYRRYGFQSCEKCKERFMMLGNGWHFTMREDI